MKEVKLLEIHALTTFGPGLTCGDKNQGQKKFVYGGVTRAEISAASIKRKIRRCPNGSLDNEVQLDTVRTVSLPDKIAQEAVAHLPESEQRSRAEEIREAVVSALGLKKGMSKKNSEEENDEPITGSNDVLPLMLSQDEIERMKSMVSMWERDGREILKDVKRNKDGQITGLKTSETFKKELLSQFDKTHPENVCFGRFKTQLEESNQEGMLYVARAVGVNRIMEEPSFFTVVDDLSGKVCNMGDFAETSDTYYFYACLDIDGMIRECSNGGVAKQVENVIRGFANYQPVTQRRSSALFHRPIFLMGVLSRDKRPFNMVQAFIKPIEFPEDAVRKLCEFTSEYEGWMEESPLAVSVKTSYDVTAFNSEPVDKIKVFMANLMDPIKRTIEARLKNDKGNA